ncbi:MAG: phosphate-starvation-inducible PsiE family protein [Candidatus Limnocylindrus sp.]
MATLRRSKVTQGGKGPVESARSALRLVEIVLDLTLAAVLLVAVLIIGGEVAHEIAVGIQSGGVEAALKILDRVLLLFIIAELIYTLRISLARSQLILEPFLIIGLVAVVRRILIATAQVEQWLVAGREISPLLYELGALAGLVLSLAIALSLARKHSGRMSDYEAD